MSGVKRFEAHYLTEGVMGGKALACAEMVLASDYDRLERECERFRLDNLSKKGSIKAFVAQVSVLQRAVKNRDKLKDRAEAERDELRAQIEAMRQALNHILAMQTRGFITLGDNATSMANDALQEDKP